MLKDATFIHSMFYDAYCCLSIEAKDHIHVQSCTCIATQTNTLHLKTRFNTKSTLQNIRLRTVSYKIAHRLAAKTLRKFKTIQYPSSKFIHDIYSNNFTINNRQRIHKYTLFA